MGRILLPHRAVHVVASAAVGGYEERRGPLGEYFDYTCPDDRFGQKSFELAEAEMARICLSFALGKAKIEKPDLLFSGDLQNQCVASSMGPASVGAPFLGLFGACSTMAEGMGLAALSLAGGDGAVNAAVVTSSHNAAAERQFRTPLEYGAQRTPTAQWTATAAGAAVLSIREEEGARISGFLPGRVVDAGITDAANMGAAMAPAAADTLLAYFAESGEDPRDLDLILTGDLGSEGSVILRTLLSEKLPDIGERHEDGGCLLYDSETSDVHAGGSGCGCIASLLAGVILPRMARGEYRRVLAIGTGALMNPASLQQGGSIAGVAHLLRLEKDI